MVVECCCSYTPYKSECKINEIDSVMSELKFIALALSWKEMQRKVSSVPNGKVRKGVIIALFLSEPWIIRAGDLNVVVGEYEKIANVVRKLGMPSINKDRERLLEMFIKNHLWEIYFRKILTCMV